jgi:hypothetical protein
MAATIHHPPSLINAYLQNKISNFFSTSAIDGQDGQTTFLIPFFPTAPISIDQVTEEFTSKNGTFAVYDRMFRMNRKNFPHIYSEQIMYYFYNFGENNIERTIIISQKIQDLLNALDESAVDINKWIRDNQNTIIPGPRIALKDMSLPLYFHTFKTYQLQETRDIIDFGTARTYAGNKIILDYDWHKYTDMPEENKGQFIYNYPDRD